MPVHKDDAAKVVNCFSRMIRGNLAAYSSEYHHPGFSADVSDDRMKESKHAVRELRRLRQEFEDLHAGVPDFSKEKPNG